MAHALLRNDPRSSKDEELAQAAGLPTTSAPVATIEKLHRMGRIRPIFRYQFVLFSIT